MIDIESKTFQAKYSTFIANSFTIVILAMVAFTLLSGTAHAADTQEDITGIKGEISAKEGQATLLKQQLASIEAELQSNVRDYQQIYGDLAETQDKIKKNEEQLDNIRRDQKYYQGLLNKRVRTIYREGEISIVEVLMTSKDFKDFLVRVDFLKKVSANDALILEEVKNLRTELEDKEKILAVEQSQEESLLQDVQDTKVVIDNLFKNYNSLIQGLDQDLIALKNQLSDKEKQLEAERKAEELRKLAEAGQMSLPIEIIFPVSGTYSFINDWHFPRSGGRLHKGTDIFAAYGSSLVAVKDGTVIKAIFTDVGLGGIALTIRGNDGNNYYYAHLSSIASGITAGTPVTAGQLVGFVGNSGNARTTPSHVHFGIYPGGGAPVNPYPYLIQAESK